MVAEAAGTEPKKLTKFQKKDLLAPNIEVRDGRYDVHLKFVATAFQENIISELDDQIGYLQEAEARLKAIGEKPPENFKEILDGLKNQKTIINGLCLLVRSSVKEVETTSPIVKNILTDVDTTLAKAKAQAAPPVAS